MRYMAGVICYGLAAKDACGLRHAAGHGQECRCSDHAAGYRVLSPSGEYDKAETYPVTYVYRPK